MVSERPVCSRWKASKLQSIHSTSAAVGCDVRQERVLLVETVDQVAHAAAPVLLLGLDGASRGLGFTRAMENSTR